MELVLTAEEHGALTPEQQQAAETQDDGQTYRLKIETNPFEVQAASETLTKERDTARAQYRESAGKVTGLQRALGEFEALKLTPTEITELQSRVKDIPAPKDPAMAALEKQVKELREQAAEARKQAETAAAARVAEQRAGVIRDAAAKAGVIPEAMPFMIEAMAKRGLAEVDGELMVGPEDSRESILSAITKSAANGFGFMFAESRGTGTAAKQTRGSVGIDPAGVDLADISDPAVRQEMAMQAAAKLYPSVAAGYVTPAGARPPDRRGG